MVAAQATPAVNSTAKATETNKTVLPSPLLGGAKRKVKPLALLRNGCSIRRSGDALYPMWEAVGPVSGLDSLPPSEEKNWGGVLEGNDEASAPESRS